MDGAVERLGTTAMSGCGVTKARVGHKEAGHNEGYTEYAKQDWPPKGTAACAEDLAESNGEAEGKQSAEKEVGDLLPSLIAQTETAHIIMPRVVAGACGTLNQKYDDKE